MKWAYRLLLGALLIAGIAHRLGPRPDLAQAASHLDRTYATLKPELVGPPEVDHNVASVSVARCPRPLIVASMPPSFTPTAILLSNKRPGDRTYFAYLDWLSTNPDRMAVITRRIGTPIMAMFGLSPYSNSRVMLFISEPGECDVVKQVDWSVYWKP
jgi:hypothetical protein